MPTTLERAGWAWPRLASKPHYFTTTGRSLCGRWAFTGELDEKQDGTTLSDCRACAKRLVALRKKEGSAV